MLLTGLLAALLFNLPRRDDQQRRVARKSAGLAARFGRRRDRDHRLVVRGASGAQLAARRR
jgi:hypothetical protein